MSEDLKPGDRVRWTPVEGVPQNGIFVHSSGAVRPRFGVICLDLDGSQWDVALNHLTKIVPEVINEEKDMNNELEKYKRKVVAVLTSLREEETVSSEDVEAIAKQLDLNDMEIARNYYLNIDLTFRYDSVNPLTEDDVRNMVKIPFDSDEEVNIRLDKFVD